MSFRWAPLSRRSGLSRRPASATQARRRLVLESLEDRTLLSSTIPLNSTSWTSIGPLGVNGVTGAGGPESGRVTAIAADPNNANVIYLASAGGGIWKTTNAGQNWTALTDNQPTLFIGSIAVSRSNPQIIYAGTGEANNSADSFQGKGVLKSTDGGANWVLLNTAQFDRKTIGQIVVNPNNPLVVYAAVSANGVNSTPGNTGIYKSTDGGVTWNNTTTAITSADTWSDLVINPSNPQVLYAAVGTAAGSATNGVYKTINGGTTWNPAGNFPISNTNGRIALAISATNPQEVIASVSNTTAAGGSLKALEKTTDAGATWTPLANAPNYLDANGNTANVVAISPSNANNLFAAGTSTNNATAIVESIDGGATWTDLTTDSAGTEPHDGSHALAFDANGLLLDGNNGGVWRLQVANPATFQWADINGDLGITNFNAVALDPTTPNIAYGGADALGVLKFNDNPVWTVIQGGGDGGHVAVDPTNAQTVYEELSGLSLRRSLNGGTTSTPIITGISPADPIARFAPFVIDPSNTNHLLFGTNRLYTSTNQGTTWTPLTTPGQNGFNDSTPIVSIAIAKNNPSTIYVATQDAKIFVSLDAGATWNEHDIPTVTDSINQIIVDPANANTAYAVRNKFNNGVVSTGHVFQTINGGATWTDISGNLPDLPTWSVAIDTIAKQLYVGTDTGVYAAPIGTSTWSVFKTGLPNAQVTSLEFNANLNLVIAGTNGRGAFEIIGTQTLIVTPILNRGTEGTPINSGTPIAQFSDPTIPTPPASSYTATITWGDGTTSTADSITLLPSGNFAIFASHTYAEEGVNPLFISVTNTNNGSSGNSLSSVTVADARLTAPTPSTQITAFEGIPFSGVVGSFTDANQGATADDFTISIRWGDGITTNGTAVATATPGVFNVVGTHTYGPASVQNTPTIRINVTDVGGSTSPTIFNSADVQDAPLTALAPLTINAVAGVPVTTTIGSFTDADPTATADYYAVAINWGDNTGTSFFAPGSGVVILNGSQFDIVASHTYSTLGTYNITATVFDEGPSSSFFGSQTTVNATADVSAAPIASGSANAITGTESVSFSGRIATFTSTNRSASVADYTTPTIDWGDNTTPTTGTIVSLGNGKFAINGTHTYVEEGTYTFTTSVQPIGSTTTTTLSNTATIADAAITVTALPQVGTAGTPLAGSNGQPPATIATFVDSNPQGTINDFTATIDWGDGTPVTLGDVTQPDGVGTPFVVTGTHTYANAQSFPITVTVNDVGGASDMQSTTAFVIEGSFGVTGMTLGSLTEGGTFTGPVATIATVNPNALASEFLASIDWGDGTITQGTVTPLGNGVFSVSDPAGHVYAEEGDYTATISVLSVSAGQTLTALSPVTVNDAPIVQVLPATPLTAQAGTSVSGVVASFTEYANAPLTDFTAVINWGDGTSSLGTVVVGSVAGTFDVLGSHLYQTSKLTFAPVVHVSDVGGSSADLTGSVVLIEPALTATPTAITALKGQTFTGTVATFTEPNPFATAGEFVASINWGDGTPATAGTVVGSNGSFSVIGSHLFNAVAAAQPVTVTIIHNIIGGATATTTSFAHILALLSAALSPTSDSGPSNHDGITRVTTPLFTGRADPNATVILFAAPSSNPAAKTQIGTVVASAAGVWSVRVGPLADGVYLVTASQFDTATGLVAQTVPVSTGARFGTLTIATSGPTVSSVSLDASTATLHVIFQTSPAGMYLGGLLNTRNYVLEAITSTGALSPLTATSISTSLLRFGRVQANVRYNGGRALANGGYVVILHAAGLIDLAGNILVEKNFVTFPQTTNSPNPDFVAEIDVINGRASAPKQFISAAERAAAAAYLRALRGRIVVRVPHPAPKTPGFTIR